MVKSIVLRGVFLFLQEDMDWLFEVGGASEIYPDKFERYVSIIPEEERGQMIEAYYKRLTSEDETTRFEAARHFVEWELNISKVRAITGDVCASANGHLRALGYAFTLRLIVCFITAYCSLIMVTCR